MNPVRADIDEMAARMDLIDPPANSIAGFEDRCKKLGVRVSFANKES